VGGREVGGKTRVCGTGVSLVAQMNRPFLTRSFWQSLSAVLARNIIYFSVERYLPPRAQHHIYRIDWGTAVDFWICLACYGLVRMIR
jgi:hypothetical protein